MWLCDSSFAGKGELWCFARFLSFNATILKSQGEIVAENSNNFLSRNVTKLTARPSRCSDDKVCAANTNSATFFEQVKWFFEHEVSAEECGPSLPLLQ